MIPTVITIPQEHPVGKVALVHITDKDGKQHALSITVGAPDQYPHMIQAEIDMIYPDGQVMGLESIWIRDER